MTDFIYFSIKRTLQLRNKVGQRKSIVSETFLKIKDKDDRPKEIEKLADNPREVMKIKRNKNERVKNHR